MRILVISRCLPLPQHYGDRLLLYHVVQHLRERGHTFELIAFHQKASDLEEIPRATVIFEHVEVIRERPRSPLDYLKRLWHPFPESAAGCWNSEMWEAVDRRLSQQHFDLVHFFGGIQVYEYRNAVRDIPRIILPYDSFALHMSRAAAHASGYLEWMRLTAISAMAHRYERIMYRGFDRIVLVSGKDQEYLQGLNPDLKTCVIPNGVDTEYFKPMDSIRYGRSLVLVGNYDYPPNADAAIALVTKILPLVRAEIPDVTVEIVGPNPPAALVSLAGEGVEITGYVSDIRPYLAKAGCCVAPMTLGSGIRNKILEAMAMGVPVVTTPVGCEAIAARPGENILVGRDPKELAECAIKLLQNEAMRTQLAEAGRQIVQRVHSWRSAASQYEALYNEVRAERQL